MGTGGNFWAFLSIFFFVGVVLKNFLFSNVPTRSLLENLSGANNKRIFSLYLLLKKGGGVPQTPVEILECISWASPLFEL